MNTGLAHLITLTSHGNWALGGSPHPRQVNLSDNPVWRFVGDLTFTRVKGEGQLEVVARTPGEWIENLHRRGVRRLAMARVEHRGRSLLPAHQAVAFAGGEPAGIVARTGDGWELWLAGWEVLDRHAADQKIWGVEYRCVAIDHPDPDSPTIAAATSRLHAVLVEIARFSSQQDLENWVPTFQAADQTLISTGAPQSLGLLPDEGYSPEARRLLAASTGAWVFGGMGSWNDTGPRDSDQQGRYDELSAELFAAILDGLVAAANGYVEA